MIARWQGPTLSRSLSLRRASPEMNASAASSSEDRASIVTTANPPSSVLGILRQLGPGLIIAGSIVGSGELIATTKTGAEAGFSLLWLIILGCVIKVFVQVELGRDAIVRGKTTLDALSDVPGPRVEGRGNWLVWYYFVMFLASLAQLGGIIGGVGQALAISAPITVEGQYENTRQDIASRIAVVNAELKAVVKLPLEKQDAAAAELNAELTALSDAKTKLDTEHPSAKRYWTDDKLWAVAVAIVTSVFLYFGRYGLIQNLSTALVAIFTMMTLANVIMLNQTQTWRITSQDILLGLSFSLPPADATNSGKALATALKTFGIIGVGATELLAYPYWCIECGYARHTGPRDQTADWAMRARGWMNVMKWDAWCSMFVYTIATIAFYLLGAAILGRTGLIPEDKDLIRTLNVMYEPVFGEWARVLFLVGAFAVLYSTYFIANAGHARVFSDSLCVVGLAKRGEAAHQSRVKILSGFLPLFCLLLFLTIPSTPAALVLLSGMMQALMLPMLSGAALFFRYCRSDKRVTPGLVWDFFLWLSSLGMLVCACVLAYGELMKFLTPR